MADYENESLTIVKQMAKRNDKDALYEMVYRIPSDIHTDPVQSCAWQDYWLERASDAGHIAAKRTYARSLINRTIDSDCRKKAMRYFESLSDDFDSGNLSGDELADGAIGKLWLGIMLCEGYYTRRDAVKGTELIETARGFFNDFDGFGFKVLSTIGELYAEGFAQPGESPSISDIEKSIKYLDMAVKRFDPDNDDPNNRGYLQLTKKMLELQKKRVAYAITHVDDKISDLSETEKKERRDKLMKISDASRQRMEADKAALEQWRKRLTKEDW